MTFWHPSRVGRFFVAPWSGGGRYFHLELGSRHRAYIGPARAGLVLLCLILGFWIAWTGMRAAKALSDRSDLQARLEQIRSQDAQVIARAQQEGFDLSSTSLQQLPGEINLANQLLEKRNFSWTQFLSGLEGTIPPRVSIKSVRLDPVSAMIYLTGAAVTVEDVTALAMKLQDHPVFREPVLGQHHAGDDGLVQFDLSLKYHPQGA